MCSSTGSIDQKFLDTLGKLLVQTSELSLSDRIKNLENVIGAFIQFEDIKMSKHNVASLKIDSELDQALKFSYVTCALGFGFLLYRIGNEFGVWDRLASRLFKRPRVTDVSISQPQRHESGYSPYSAPPIDLLSDERNLTLRAKKGSLPKMTKRKKITDQVVAGLIRNDKPHILLIGPPGSGKTAFVKSLAQELLTPEILSQKTVAHPKLKNVRIIEASAADFQSGCTVVGMAEQRFQSIIGQLKSVSGPVILFIDEIHSLLIVHHQYTPAVADMLKPYLAEESDLHVIGCTTQDEFDQYVKTDAAFTRRFECIEVPEPDDTTLRSMIDARVADYSQTYQCAYDPDAVKTAIQMAKELPGFNPDKTLTVLDNAGAYCFLNDTSGSPRVTKKMVEEVVRNKPHRDPPSYLM